MFGVLVAASMNPISVMNEKRKLLLGEMALTWAESTVWLIAARPIRRNKNRKRCIQKGLRVD